MKLKTVYTYLLLLSGIIILNNCQQAVELSPNSLNFLIITADDLDYSELGCYGGEIPTPNIDALAQKGVQFTNFYTSQDDSKARSMLLTGTSQAQVPSTQQLSPQTMTIAQILQEVGYRTMISGKWNLGTAKADMPIEKGFEQSFVLVQEMSNHLGNKRTIPATFRENNNIQEISEDFYSTQYFARKLLSFLSKGKKKKLRQPFFAMLSFTAPHYPLQAPARSIQNFSSQYDEGYQAIYEERLANQLKLGIHTSVDEVNLPEWSDLSEEEQQMEAKKMEIYAAMIFDMDRQIGQVIDYLKVSKKYDNTIVVFLADGGVSEPKSSSIASLGKTNSMASLGDNWTNIKLGNKGNNGIATFDNAVKAPLIISSPLLEKSKSSRDKTLRTINDITPTILELIGITHPSENYFTDVLSVEGQSLLSQPTTDNR
ncbi:MAG: sulfatase-like hydrolase/transferase [Bacteroidota bacterium]